jgi:hypothetical protein
MSAAAGKAMNESAANRFLTSTAKIKPITIRVIRTLGAETQTTAQSKPLAAIQDQDCSDDLIEVVIPIRAARAKLKINHGKLIAKITEGIFASL